jgi:tRNA threonylcarbamoyladenosine biosynthesis protein TsaB
VLLLALDTASATVSAALHDGTTVLAARSGPPDGRHAERLAPLVEEVLTAADAAPGDLSGIAVGVGPGPFTGLRVGLATARVLGMSLDVPVHGVCSLDAVAFGAVRRGLTADRFLVATDARRREVYWAAYQQAGTDAVPVRAGEPQVGAAVDVPVDGRPVAGRGAELYPDVLGPARAPLDPDAADLARLAAVLLVAGAALEPDPLYLRRPDAQVPKARKRVGP